MGRFGRVPTFLFLLVLALTGPGAISAQSPADRAAIAAWDDSLQHLRVTVSLDKYDVQSRAASGNLKNIRRSLFLLRSAELKSDLGARQNAMDNLALDLSQHSDWVWPRLVLARSFIALHRERASTGTWGGQLEGESLIESAWRQIRVIVEREPEFGPGKNLLLDLMVAAGDREMHGDQMAPLKIEPPQPHPDGRALLVWGRYLRDKELYDSALKVFTRAVFAGEDASRLALERAHAFRGLNDTASARVAYWDGLEHVTKAGREAYRYDLAWMLSKDSLAVFDKVPDDSLIHWIRRFWNERDAASANHLGERLMEQLRRWNYVVANFRVTQPWRKTDHSRTELKFDELYNCVTPDTKLYEDLWALQPTLANDIRDRERLLDQRGLVYLHHGAPSLMSPIRPWPYDPLNPPLDEQTWVTSWLYWFGDAWRLLHFRGSYALGMEAPTTLESFLPMNRWLYQDMSNFAVPEYARVYGLLEENVHDSVLGDKPTNWVCNSLTLQQVVAKARDDVHLAIRTDSDSPPLTSVWDGTVEMFALGHAVEQNGKALITFAIPAAKLKSDTGPEGHPVWPMRVRMVAYDATTNQTVEVDSLRSFDPKPVNAKNQYLTGWFELPLGPGVWQIAMRMNQQSDSVGMFSLQRHLVIDSKPDLALSDVVLGVVGAQPWRAPDQRIFPVNALGTWKEKSVLELYYEVRGVMVNAEYQTSVQVHEGNAVGKSLINVTSKDRSEGMLTTVRKSVGLDQLKPGSYVLVVTITANGQSVFRQSGFTVVKP